MIYKYDCGNGNTATFTMMSEHQTQLVEGKAATCEEAGQKSHYKCSICGKLFTGADAATETTEDALIIPPTGHQWGEPVIVFAEDGKSATASVTCQTDKNHVKDLSSSVSVTSEVGTPATCEGKGTTLYTAKVIFEGESYTATKEVEDIEAIGHSWGATTYEWTEDGAACTAKRVCENDGSHIETAQATVTSKESQTPTCTEKGETTYTATFAVSWATAQTKTIADIAATGHSWGATTYEWTEDGKSCTAKRVCENDGSHIETAQATVTSKESQTPTCTEKGETTYTATFAVSWATAQTKTIADIAATGHSWKTPTYEWSEDGKSCTAKRVCRNDETHTETATATVNGVQSKEPTCTDKGETTYTATVVFGDKIYTDTTTRQDLPIDPENHNNRLVEVEAKEPTCTEDGNHAHWRCDGCNKLFSDAEGKSEISVDEVTIDALGHTAEKVAGQAPTYTSAGWKDYWKCSVCQKLFEEESCTTEITDLESWKTGKGRLDQLTRPQKPDSGEDDKDEKPSERPESSEETESIVKPNTSNKPDSSVKPEQPNGNNNAAVTVKPTITEDTAKVELSKETIDRTIAKAEKKSKENISVEVESKTGNSNNLSFDLPKATVEALVKKNVQELKLNTDSVDITLSRELLKEIQNQMATDVRLTIQKIDNSKLDAQAKSIIGNRPVYTFSIVGSNGKQLTDFGKGRVSIFLPYTINAGENPAALLAYQIDQSGKAIQLSNSAYLSERQAVGLVADTVSCFAVGYKNVPAFTDTANHWAKSSIEYVVASGLLSETGNRTFSPDASMTAEVFAAALGKLAGAKAGTDSSYLEWVNNLGIMNGLGEGKLQTQQKMTREQIAVALYNYAKYIGFELPKSYEENIFTDANQVQENAKQAVKAMQMAGILAGKDGNRFDPKTNVTRAEMAVILERFVKVLIVGGSSEGWMCNDSGKWMYYENGKAVTGKKKIDGKTYTFNNEGVVAKETKSKESASKPVSKVNTSGKLSIKNILLNLFSSRK